MPIKRLPLAAVIIVLAGALAWAAAQWSGTPDEPEPPAQSPAQAGAGEAPADETGAVTLAVVGAESTARYRVREQLANLNFPNDAVGETKSIAGSVQFDEDGNIVAGSSQIAVNLASLRSDQSMRDNFVRQNILQTSRYPQARFVPTRIAGLPYPLPESGEAEVTIYGDLTIRNVTRPVEWTGTVYFEPGNMRVAAGTTLTFEQFEMTKPRVALVLSVADEIRLEADLLFAKSSP